MANATIGVGTYAGQMALPYVASAILSADTIANGYVSVLENVYSKAVLRKFSGTAIQKNDDCAFTSAPDGSCERHADLGPDSKATGRTCITKSKHL